MLEQDFSYQGNHSQLNPRDTFNPNLEQKHQHFVIHLSQFYPPIYLQGTVFPSPVIPTTFFRNRERNDRSASRRRKIRKTKKKKKRRGGRGWILRAREKEKDGKILSRRGSGVRDVCSRGIKKSRAFFISSRRSSFATAFHAAPLAPFLPRFYAPTTRNL